MKRKDTLEAIKVVLLENRKDILEAFERPTKFTQDVLNRTSAQVLDMLLDLGMLPERMYREYKTENPIAQTCHKFEEDLNTIEVLVENCPITEWTTFRNK